MSEEITEAVQIVRVAYDGIDVAMRVGSGGIKAMLDVATFIFGMIDHEKLKGQTSMKKLLLKGGDLQVVKLDDSQKAEAKKLLKKYGVLYSTLPDLNREDGMFEILVHSEAVPRVNLILEKLGKGSLTSIEEYMQNGDKTGFNKLVNFFDNQRSIKPKTEEEKEANKQIDNLLGKVADFAIGKKEFDKSEMKEHFGISDTRVDDVLAELSSMGALAIREDGTYEAVMDKEQFQERIRHYQKMANRVEKEAMLKSGNVEQVTLDKTIVVREDEKVIKVSLGDKEDRFIYLDKENLLDDGKLYRTYLKKDADYLIYDKNDKRVEVVSLDNLVSRIQNVQVAKAMKKDEKKQTKEKQTKEKSAEKKVR
jgi:hypothetical protein